jgi:hypothetical protein
MANRIPNRTHMTGWPHPVEIGFREHGHVGSSWSGPPTSIGSNHRLALPKADPEDDVAKTLPSATVSPCFATFSNTVDF